MTSVQEIASEMAESSEQLEVRGGDSTKVDVAKQIGALAKRLIVSKDQVEPCRGDQGARTDLMQSVIDREKFLVDDRYL